MRAGSGRRAASASADALATSSLASARSSAARSAVRTPPAISSASIRSMGSRTRSAASSSAERYLLWVSAAEWEYGRTTSAWMRAGPTPARTRSMIDRATSRTVK